MIMVITILLIIINRFTTGLYSVRQIASQYHYYWYVKLVTNTPTIVITLLQRFINDINHLNISLSHLVIITVRMIIFPTTLIP